MHVHHGFDHLALRLRGMALAIGNFDGVHRGHQALLAQTIAVARPQAHPAGAMVFEPHPRQYFQPDHPQFRLTSLPQKLRLFAKAGLDLTVVVPFDAALAGLSASEFIERVLVAGLGVRHVVIGYDFFFGKDRTGNPQLMEAAGRDMGFGVSVVAPVAEGGEAFSSSEVRLLLAQGDIPGAAHVLGHWWRVQGKVVGGARRGTGMGFPTANVPMPKGTALAHGIYAVRVHMGGGDTGGTTHHLGAAYLGTRPTFDNGMPVLEVFLLDFDGDLYGREIEVEFIAHIRADRKFDTVDALVAQMAADCEEARAILARVAADDPMARFPLGKP